MATHGNGSRAHGKEGVDGSSPSEGSAKAPDIGTGLRSWLLRVNCGPNGGMDVDRDFFIDLHDRPGRPARNLVTLRGGVTRVRRGPTPGCVGERACGVC